MADDNDALFQPLLSEATKEQLFHELRSRVDFLLLAFVTGAGTEDEGVEYYHSGSPFGVLGMVKVVAKELGQFLSSGFDPNSGEEWKESSDV